MALFSQNHRRSPRIPGGIPGRATIRVSEPGGEQWSRQSDDTALLLNLELNHFGTRDYRFVLEVETDLHGTYLCDDFHDVPRRAENTGLLAPSVGNHLTPGLELPVVVDPADPQHVEIDWPAFLNDPERKKKQKAAYQADYTERVAQAQIENPRDPAPKTRRNNAIAVLAWVDAVRQGSMSRETFDEMVETAVSKDRLDPDDAQAARAKLG